MANNLKLGESTEISHETAVFIKEINGLSETLSRLEKLPEDISGNFNPLNTDLALQWQEIQKACTQV